MEVIALLGRITFSMMFIASGINHISKHRYMTEYAQSARVPMAAAAVGTSGVVILAGASMIMFGIWGDLGAALIVAFLLPTSYFMHGFWRFDDPETRQQQQMHFMKNMTMAGGALAIVALFMCGGDTLGLSATGSLFSG